MIADGYSPVATSVYGTDADGTPIHEAIVVRPERAGGGEFVSPAFRIDDLGGGSNFIPCNSVEPGCTGPLRLLAALASSPDVIVAHVDVELMAPNPIASAQQCLSGGNVFYVDGTNHLVNGMVTAPDGYWDVFGSEDRAVVHLGISTGSWSFEVTTRQLGIKMLPSVYEDADLPNNARFGHAGMAISIPSTSFGCERDAHFQVHTFNVTGTLISELTVSFEIICDFDPTRRLKGCVHYAL
jgi:hypothetical protein